MASFMRSDRPVFVLDLLLAELVRRRLVLPKEEAYFNKKCERARHEQPRPYLKLFFRQPIDAFVKECRWITFVLCPFQPAGLEYELVLHGPVPQVAADLCTRVT